MTTIWFRLETDPAGLYRSVECTTLDSAQIVFDALARDLKHIMLCKRP